MLRLDLSRDPVWLELTAGVRLCLAPLTTALMVSARNDAAVLALPEDASDEDRALVYAKAIARRALLGCPRRPRASATSRARAGPS
jgi:hypothetical protein